MSIWQPRSVRQLVFVGFFTAFAPLCVAIFFNIQTLGEIADRNRDVTDRVVAASRLGQNIQRDVLDLERRARQYLTLVDDDLGRLFETERDKLTYELAALQELLPTESPDVSGLISSLEGWELSLPEPGELDATGAPVNPEDGHKRQFDRIELQSLAVQKWVRASVDLMVEENAAEEDRLITFTTVQLSLLTATTLALLLFFAYWINRPLRALSREIQQLGAEGLTHQIDIAGPRELRELSDKLEWLRQQLHQSDQDKQQFLRHISHELKTPLASLREGTDLLSEQVTGHLSAQQAEIVEILRHNAIALQRLIENLVDFNQTPHQELKVEKIQLSTLWEDILAPYRITIDNKALRLTLKGKVDTWTADRSKLRTALDNLVSNAVNYTPDGGVIKVKWLESGGKLRVIVANSGEPIPEQDTEKVFEPFFQSAAKRTGPLKGSGIGLSVARECMLAQGGNLTLEQDGKLPVCFQATCPAL